MTQAEEVVLTQDAQHHPNFSLATVGENTYTLEIQQYVDGNVDILVFRGKEVTAGSRVASVSKYGTIGRINSSLRNDLSSPRFFEKQVLIDVLAIAEKVFEGNPVQTYEF